MIRLDRALAHQGLLSRNDIKKLITDGLVTVDGLIVRNSAQKIDPDKTVVCVEGKIVSMKKHIYLMLHKPAGYVSTTDDKDDPSVLALVPEKYRRKNLFPAGRLDKDTTGLMIITDDGDFAHRILSPSHHIPKTYLATLDTPPTSEMCRRFAEGILLNDGACKPADMDIIDNETAQVVLTEGRYHQVKRMFQICGACVTHLKRIQMGRLSLPDNMPEGTCRELTDDELKLLEQK